MHTKPTGFKSIAGWKRECESYIADYSRMLQSGRFNGKKMGAADRAFLEKELASYRSFLVDIESGNCKE